MSVQNETIASLFEALKMTETQPTQAMQDMIDADTRYLKDLKINVTNALKFPNLNAKESALLALSVAINQRHDLLIQTFRNLALEHGATVAELGEIAACTSLLNVNNVFYRFRHYAEIEYYNTTPAGIKMSVMGSPVMGKEFFELVSLAVSALNGCEACVRSHEASVVSHGSSQARVYDAVRLAAIVKGYTVLV